MKRIAIIAVGILTSLALAVPADAATVSITDVRGDANALNDQQLSGCYIQNIPGGVPDVCSPEGIPNHTSTGPVSYEAGDIVKASVGTLFKRVGSRKVATAMQVKLTLADDVASQGSFLHRVDGDLAQADGCTTFQITYTVYADGTKLSRVRTCDPDGALGEKSAYVNVGSKVSGATITWTVPFSVLSGQGVRTGSVMQDIGADVRVMAGTTLTGGATVPAIDIATSTRDYKLGK